MLEGARVWSVSMPVLEDGEPSCDFWLRNQCIQQFQSGPWSLPMADIMFDAIPASGVEEGKPRLHRRNSGTGRHRARCDALIA